MNVEHGFTRRRLLELGALGTRFAGLARVRAADPPVAIAPKRTIRSCILVFFYGGPSHLDTFDPKPNAPAEVRGEYRTIGTAVPGVRVSEHLPRMARVLDRVALVRGLHHPMRNHNSAAAEALTGRTPAGGDQELLADDPRGIPTLGSAVSFALGARAGSLPYVALPYTIYNVVQLPGQTPGLLGGAFDRFQVTGDPNAPDFRIAAFENATELGARAELLRGLDRSALPGPVAQAAVSRDRAVRLLANPDVRRLFDIHKEPQRVRDRYGRHLLGQSLLLARRLVEGGVNFVTAFDGRTNGQDANWDSHEKLFPRHRQLIPPADQALSALIEDLGARGLLDSTLVLALSEFGRTPKINGSAGRDHWPDCYTALVAGGGVTGGAVLGSSDKIGAYPATDPVTPADLAATVFWRFGIDPATEVRDQTARPFRLSEGEPVRTLFGG
ncbi:DUF1501 domain-containing protein [Gemmata sp. G18]|uniref:DUF1501 domain-containing protein n=1 Tax=Gemmata palustris TaxID=2822762 RepID=A0ABS5BKP3_9BACT|nr:DUF1501 domain-containing protein [Gemmata palustris]MBP3954280.1 DUF1501 domain-containing protein [Gemmata palustris]